MHFNYSKHIHLLKHEILDGLNPHHKRLTHEIWCMIIHFTKFKGQCVFAQTVFCEYTGYTQRDCRKAIKLLMSKKAIKLVTPFCSKTRTPAVYSVDTACVPAGWDLCTGGSKPVYPQASKIILNNIKRESDSFLKSLPPDIAKLAEQQLKAGIPEENVKKSVAKFVR